MKGLNEHSNPHHLRNSPEGRYDSVGVHVLETESAGADEGRQTGRSLRRWNSNRADLENECRLITFRHILT